jgi:hypothetical protein
MGQNFNQHNSLRNQHGNHINHTYVYATCVPITYVTSVKYEQLDWYLASRLPRISDKVKTFDVG